MRRIFILIVTILAILLSATAFKNLPGDTDTDIQEKYDTWTGVIRVWVEEGISTGGWLRECAKVLEKAHPGVYIHLRSVPAVAFSAMETGCDLMIGQESSLEGVPCASLSLRPGYRAGISVQDQRYPILTDSFLWVYDTEKLTALPEDWRGVPIACETENQAALPALCGWDATALTLVESPEEAWARLVPFTEAGLYRDRGDVTLAVSGEFAISAGRVCAAVPSSVAEDRKALTEAFIGILTGRGQASAARTGYLPVTDTAAWTNDLFLSDIEAQLSRKRWTLQ